MSSLGTRVVRGLPTYFSAGSAHLCSSNRLKLVVVPFRDSKLTRVFQGFFTGRGRSSMIVNISQCASMYDETLHVAKFSALASQVSEMRKCCGPWQCRGFSGSSMNPVAGLDLRPPPAPMQVSCCPSVQVGEAVLAKVHCAPRSCHLAQ